MNKAFCWLVAMTLCLVMLGCSDHQSPQAVAQQFWQAMAEGELDTAKGLASAGSMDGVTLSSRIGKVQLGESRQQDSATLVATSLEKATGDGVVELSFDTVVVLEDSLWRVDFNRTVKSMVGNSLTQLRQAIGESVNEMGRSVGEAVDEALNDAVEEVNEALQGAAEEMQKAADELRREK